MQSHRKYQPIPVSNLLSILLKKGAVCQKLTHMRLRGFSELLNNIRYFLIWLRKGQIDAVLTFTSPVWEHLEQTSVKKNRQIRGYIRDHQKTGEIPRN